MPTFIKRTISYLGERVRITFAVPTNEEHNLYLATRWGIESEVELVKFRAKEFDKRVEAMEGVDKDAMLESAKSSVIFHLLEDFSVSKN